MNKKSFSREAAEEAEGLEHVKNEVPENMVQSEQQVQPADAALKTEGPKSSFQPKKSSAKGQTLKQEVISEAITGSSSSAGMGINAAGRSASGTVGGILGANNSAPQADKSRSETRTGKKLDRVATKLNYTPCETALLEVDESKPLADAADQDQGFNGTYRNEFGRSQKIMGAVPADLMFQRSVDLIMKDKLYFVEGQQVYQNADDRLSLDPSLMVDIDSTSDKPQYIPMNIHSGDYLHRNMHVGLKPNGKVKYVYFDVDDITPDAVSADDANCSSAHRLIKMNTAELDRMSMDAKAGDEKADIWTPLARAIKEPTKWAYLLSSIEADTGAYCYLAYSKASTNMAFQLNRGAKDGLSTIIPAQEQLVGWRSSYSQSTDFKDAEHEDLKSYFTHENYQKGDPSIMIDAYDSISKYNNKADLLLQPRGWRMHLQTADNNINPLRIPSEFANVFAGTEVFSTIDREYDPLMPICMTDKANLITVHNFNELAAFHEDAGYRRIDVTFSAQSIASDYAHDEMVLAATGAAKRMGWPHQYLYVKKVGNHVDFNYNASTGVLTIDNFTFGDVEDGFISAIVTPDELDITTEEYTGYVKVTDVSLNAEFDIVFYVPKASAVDALNVQYDYENNKWLYYGAAKIAYAYSDLRNNYYVHVKHPLIFGIVEYLNEAIGGKFYNLLSGKELFVPFIFSTQYMTLAQLLICAATPWIERVRANSMKDIIYYQENVGSYPFSKLSSIKEVPFKNYANFNFSDYDTPLETKVMNPVQAINWVMPEFFWKVADESFVLPWYFCENDLLADGTVDDDASTMCFPSIRSGIRLSFLDNLYGMTEKDVRLSLDRMTKTLLRDEDITSKYAYKYGKTTDGQVLAILDSGKKFTIKKVLSCPRELGLVMDAPMGVLTVDPINGEGLTYSLATLSDDGTPTSYRIKVWTNPETPVEPSILNDRGVNIARAANYSQKWVELTANADGSKNQLCGLVFGLGDDADIFSPFASLSNGSSAGLELTVSSLQRSINTRIQFLPFVISPFDAVKNAYLDYSHDIYDFAYYFGLCGFRASDYRESIYNRSKEAVNQGLLFVNDPWIDASPIIKGASAATGVKVTKGYELKN